MNNENELLRCRYQPVWFVMAVFMSTLFIILIKNSEKKLVEINSFYDFIVFISTQNEYSIFLLIFLFFVFILFLKAELVITSNTIYVESFGFVLRFIVDKELLQNVRLYSNFASRTKLIKSLSKKKLSYDEKLKKSSIGFCLLPEFRDENIMKQLNLKQFDTSIRRKIVETLSKNWGMDDNRFVSKYELIRLKLKHKLR